MISTSWSQVAARALDIACVKSKAGADIGYTKSTRPHRRTGTANPLLVAIQFPVPGCGQATAHPFRSVSRADGADLSNASTAMAGRRPSCHTADPSGYPTPMLTPDAVISRPCSPGPCCFRRRLFTIMIRSHARIVDPFCSWLRWSKQLAHLSLSSSTLINTGTRWSQTARKRYRPHRGLRGKNGPEHLQF